MELSKPTKPAPSMPKCKPAKDEKFNYCIGFNWPNSESIGLYSYGTNHWYGTMEAAENTLEFIQDQSDDGSKYFICRIEKI